MAISLVKKFPNILGEKGQALASIKRLQKADFEGFDAYMQRVRR